MKQKLCNAAITFSDGRSVVIEDLNERQTLKLSELLQASGVWYQWVGDYPGLRQQAPGGKISRAWRRLNIWMMGGLLLLFLALFLILPPSVAAQGVIKAVEPIRASIVTEVEPEAPEAVRYFHRAFKAELNKTRGVVISQRRGGLNVYLSAQALTAKDDPRGFVAVVVVISDAKPRELFWLTLKTGAALEVIAREAVAEMNRAVFRAEGQER